MFHVTKMADYAVVLLCEFALSDTQRMSARDVAARCGLGEPTVMKILKLLTRADLLESVRGANGGYCMARSKENISLHDVITAVEGAPSVTDCQQQDYKKYSHNIPREQCEYQQYCPARFGWEAVNQHMNNYLKSVTIKDFMAACPKEYKRLNHSNAVTQAG